MRPRELVPNQRAAGILVLAGALAMLGFMAAHPAIHAHDPSGFVAELERKAAAARIVHGALVAAALLVLLGLLGLVDRLGWRGALARGGLLAYALGTLAHAGAALVNGFVVPALGARYADELDTLRPLLGLCRELNGAAARLGVFATSAGIALWSLALVLRAGLARAVGVLGMVCGLILPIAFGALRLPMDVHGFGLRVVAQAAWQLAVAVLLLRRPR